MVAFIKLIKDHLILKSLTVNPSLLINFINYKKNNKHYDRIVLGRFIHHDGVPIVGLEVQLWSGNILGRSSNLGAAETDANGNFIISYNTSKGFGYCSDILLRIYEQVQENQVNGKVLKRRIQVAQMRKFRNPEEKLQDLGDIKIAFYEYSSELKIPFAARASMYKEFGPNASNNFYSNFGKFGLIHNKMEFRMLAGAKPTPQEIQDLYPRSKTMVMEEERPGSSRTDSYFGSRILDGFCPALFKKRSDDPNGLHLAFQWSQFDLTGLLDLPDIAARFEIQNEMLVPSWITLRFRKPDGLMRFGEYESPRTFKPSDGEEWDIAKRVFRAVYFRLIGQVHGHVGIGHLNMEQYALAISRNLRKSPLKSILMPHLKEVLSINERAYDILLNQEDGFFAKVKPIDPKSSFIWYESNLGCLDWYNWKPREPLCPTQTYSHGAKLYWEILEEYLEEVFTTQKDAFKEHWSEVLAFERDLLDHSVPFMPKRMQETNDDLHWLDVNEISKDHPKRLERNNQKLAITPITNKGAFTDEALANLKQLCKYCIFMTTYYHGWFHNEIKDELADVFYSSLCRNGSMKPETDVSMLPSVGFLNLTLKIVHIIAELNSDLLLKNEEGDIPPQLIKAIKSRAKEFEAIGYDLSLLRAGLTG